MTVTINITCNNAAFREDDDTGDNRAATGAEVARILRRLADDYSDDIGSESSHALFDSNGNKVGEACANG